jgi:diacylglycerol kinase (ATP)
MNDGWLEVVFVPVLPTFELMTAGLGFMLGFEQMPESVSMFRAKRVRLRSDPPMPFSIDGELALCADIGFEIMPAVLKVLIGDYPAAIDESRLEGGGNAT